ncbi:MAG TPA: nucleotidyl transferase AbiEii/AbiGii toxin family protein [Solirubrobacteraceae bacterium]|nr:nucleotidyl transferase AbiEii/AbiGii toxin family protein [Solirubrobacteraceae bacterium]
MTRVEEALRRIVADLERTSRAFALVGGFAVSSRTEPRFTRDVDLVVAVPNDAAAEGLLNELRTHGYSLVAAVEQLAANRLATARLASPSTSDDELIVDLLFASSGVEVEIAARAELLEVLPGLVVPVARIGDLLALKLLSRDDAVRPLDAADLRALCSVARPDDLALARETAMLIQRRGYGRGRDLLAALDDLLAGA